MPPRKKSSGSRASSVIDETTRPDVIVDFRFERGLLYVALINLSDAPAYRVSVKFDNPFRGLDGECAVSSLAMFRRVQFLAPHKLIETLLDCSFAYFTRREPTIIKTAVSFWDAPVNNKGNDKENADRTLTGLEHFGNVLLKRGAIGSLNLYGWYNDVRNGDQNALRTVTIQLQNEDHTAVVLTWKLRRARPVKIKFGPLNAKGNDVVIETLELACERLEME